MINNNKKPAVRFQEFSDDWIKRRIDELLEERNVQTPKSDEYPLMAFVANKGVTPKGDRYNRDFLVNDSEKKKYKQTEKGDFIYSSNNLETGSIGINEYGNAVISPVYSIFRPFSSADSNYIGVALKRKSFIAEMVKWRQGVVYGQWRIHESDFLAIESYFPDIEEQKQIGLFFENLNKYIESFQKEVEKYSILRETLLHKMFPQDGKLQPEIRFGGFEGDWEKKKLGMLGNVLTCKRVFKEETMRTGEIPFYKNGTLGLEPDAYISRELFEEYKALFPYPKRGDILITVVGSIGRTTEYMGDDEYFQDSNIVWLNTDCVDSKFLKVSYKVIKWMVEGSTIKHLYNDNILKSEIYVPKTKEEQHEIGMFFEKLDNLIETSEEELKKLKSLRVACMQKMLV